MQPSLRAFLRTGTRRFTWLLAGAAVASAATMAVQPDGHTSPPRSADLHTVINAKLTAVPASTDEVMSIPGIKGESLLSGYRGSTDLESIAVGASSPAAISSSGISQSTPKFGSLVVTRPFDLASTQLLAAMSKRTDLGTVKLFILKRVNEDKSLVITLGHAHITQVQHAIAFDSVKETVSLAYTAIRYDYYVYAPDGTATGGIQTMCWNVENNTSTCP